MTFWIFLIWYGSGFLSMILFKKYSKKKNINGEFLVYTFFWSFFGFIATGIMIIGALLLWWESPDGEKFRKKEFF